MQRAVCAAGAEAVLVLHAGYAAFILLGLAAVAEGAALRWDWVRRPAWRWAHAAAILLVCGLQLLGLACPLTAAEDALRSCAGQASYREGFLADRAGVSPASAARAELFLGALALAGLALVPPRRRTA